MKLIEKQLINIVSNFFPDAKDCVFTLLTSGHINETFRVDLKEESYVLQRLNTNVFPNPNAIMHNALKVATHLEIKKYPHQILKPLATKNNTFLHQTDATDYWRMTPFFSDTITLETPENTKQAYVAAAAFGEFLQYLNDLPASEVDVIIPDFHNANFRISQFENALKNANKFRMKQAEIEISEIKRTFSFLERLSALKLPSRVMHNDTKISNILFSKDKETAVAVIDWDTIMPGTILSDFGDCVRTFCTNAAEDERDLSKVKFREEYYEVVEKGFLSTTDRMLTNLEKKHLRDGAKQVILVQAMRFLTDYLEGDIYYKASREEQNLDRARNQLELFKQISTKQSPD
ncbi:MAG: thiamine kinase-like enzyme [Saprospiraceae bacterium]|jgi:thiamine kinase-like enzyme